LWSITNKLKILQKKYCFKLRLDLLELKFWWDFFGSDLRRFFENKTPSKREEGVNKFNLNS